ncbi:hypothetical protein [Pseudonocardia acidicola]|uniref:Uncharacterized protein n=1 Tax=Pseudonocardia acidicola TaxID=2724939 RepID=A0ABX1S9H9_9PSEU|nr:hypothetical protein [Pseudonocardia acidicola]NMH98225.1 hypothetical protein [Pseudonocardia acidicola]
MVRLSPPDEYFTHQVAYPHAMVGSSDPSWRERYWISLQDIAAKDTVLSVGLGQYPNQDVQEGFAVLSDGRTQTNVRVARALSPRNDVMHIGPLRVEVVKPFEELRLILDDNPSGLAFDITWSSRLEPVLEGRHFEVSRTRVTHDAIRYVQLGRASGTLTGPGGERTLTPETWWGERDHSWGTRPLPRAQGAPPGARPEWTMLMFCPLQLPEFGLHFYLKEAEPGRPLHLSAGISRPFGAPDEEEMIVGLDHDLRWVEGAAAPTLEGGRITLSLGSGRKLDFDLTAQVGRAHLRGGGYEGWNGWYQGHWKGDDSLEHETWDLTDRDQFYRYAKAGSDHLVEVRHEGQVGYGIMEYMVLPGYPRYQEAIPPRREGRA